MRRNELRNNILYAPYRKLLKDDRALNLSGYAHSFVDLKKQEMISFDNSGGYISGGLDANDKRSERLYRKSII